MPRKTTEVNESFVKEVKEVNFLNAIANEVNGCVNETETQSFVDEFAFFGFIDSKGKMPRIQARGANTT